MISKKPTLVEIWVAKSTRVKQNFAETITRQSRLELDHLYEYSHQDYFEKTYVWEF